MTAAALEETRALISQLRGSPDQQRFVMFSTVPAVTEHYGSATASLAVDAYDEARAGAVGSGYSARPFVPRDDEKLRRGIAWATDPLYQQDRLADAVQVEMDRRFRDIVSGEVIRPYRATTLENVKRDPSAIGWRRITGGHGCDFCRMLASRGAVYRKEITAIFAAHDNCDCTAQVKFQGEIVTEANTLQYMASKRSRSRAEKDRVNEYVRDWSDNVA